MTGCFLRNVVAGLYHAELYAVPRSKLGNVGAGNGGINTRLRRSVQLCLFEGKGGRKTRRGWMDREAERQRRQISADSSNRLLG
eukprot:752915-Hanusia_phi.AAC.2